jgi:hypothetical protein
MASYFFDHHWDAQQLLSQLYLGLIPVLVAFETNWFALELDFLFGFALLFLGLSCCFLG